MNIKQLSLGLALLVVSYSSLGVDGYKGVKFGSSFNDLNSANICSWQEKKDELKGVNSYYCDDFKFSGKDTIAAAFFINERFERFAIVLGQDIGAVLEGLKNKYGPPSSMVTLEDIEKYQSQGGSLNIEFDKGTIILNATRENSSGKEKTLLVYTTTEFESLYNKIRANGLKNDI
ncbi:hypothetical protein [Serratia fonticola]